MREDDTLTTLLCREMGFAPNQKAASLPVGFYTSNTEGEILVRISELEEDCLSVGGLKACAVSRFVLQKFAEQGIRRTSIRI